MKEREKIIICDIDDCMCDSSAMVEHIPADQNDLDGWRKCYKYLDKCAPNKPFIDYILQANKHYKIIFITCREDYGSNRKKTLQQLKNFTNDEVRIEKLLMRKKGDTRVDWIVKEELLEQEVLPKYNVVVAFDDKEENCLMYRRHGIKDRLYAIAEDRFY